jgi:hypothetical protein
LGDGPNSLVAVTGRIRKKLIQAQLEALPAPRSDAVLWIAPDLVLIPEDGMAHVFDYDPLVIEIERLAADGLYETQERLMTRIVQACAAYPVIEALDIALRKFPVRAGSGSLGVRSSVDGIQLLHMRQAGANWA